MGLTLVLGPANSAKAGEVLGAYVAAAPRGALLVVPTAADADHYTRELAGDGLVQGSVLTFGGLAAEIARRVGYGTRRLSRLQREQVLRGIVARLPFAALRDSAPAPGFAIAAGALIAELQRALVTPQRLTAALRAWAAQDVRRAAYARDVGRLYGDYVRELDELGRVDNELFAWRALDALRAAPERWSRPTRDPVFFYGFDDLSALERDAIETLARIVDVPVTVSLTYEPGRAALSARASTVEELRPLAERVRELEASDAHYRPDARAVLHHLERCLFEPEPARVAAGQAVTLLEAGGERAEAELVAAHILELRRSGLAGAEIALVYRSPASVAPLLARVFSQYGLALADDPEPPLRHTALGRALLGAARCALLGLEVASAADLLDYLRAPGWLRAAEIADGLEADVRRRGLHTAAQARAALGWELAELAVLAELGGTHDATGAGAAAGDWAVTCGWLRRLGARLLAAPHAGQAARLNAGEALDARALATLHRALDELSELARRPGPVELIELLAELPVAGRRGPPARDEVVLADPAAIRARRFRAVFVCGLQEGEFPRPGREEPFLSDERRHELALASGLRLRSSGDALDGERYLFYAAVSRATERVFLAYRSSDEEGNLALASPFVSDVAEVLDPGWRQRRRRRLLADVVWPADEAPVPRERERADAAARAPAVGGDPEPARVLGAVALQRVRHTRIVSAGALERYSDCPMRWLVESQLAPEPLAPTPEPIVRGSVMHALLERTIAELGGPVTEASLAEAEAILDLLVDELSQTGAELAIGEPAVVRAGAVRAIEADLRRYLEHEAASGAAWRPFGLELGFGFDEEASAPPLALGEGAEPVFVRGLIDRIDVDADGRALIRDYKSGPRGADQPVARWQQDRRLQVALYMLVARDLLSLDVVAGIYQPLRGEDLRARGVFVAGTELGSGVVSRDARSPEEVDAALADAAARAIALAARLRAGDLTPCPSTCSRDGCAHPAICRSR
ncbi:MAG: PD-(D/E)XK nuclease family protein [Solirubrobacterales bacterium]|nr:PD-(D/E)XK nuclease family protein [Solirubrobacterales bacterium]